MDALASLIFCDYRFWVFLMGICALFLKSMKHAQWNPAEFTNEKNRYHFLSVACTVVIFTRHWGVTLDSTVLSGSFQVLAMDSSLRWGKTSAKLVIKNLNSDARHSFGWSQWRDGWSDSDGNLPDFSAVWKQMKALNPSCCSWKSSPKGLCWFASLG